MPGEKIVDLLDGMIGNTRENIGQIGLWLDAVHFARFDDGVQAGGALSAGVGATKEVILASQDYRGAILPISTER